MALDDDDDDDAEETSVDIFKYVKYRHVKSNYTSVYISKVS